jgi:hypothetical protein
MYSVTSLERYSRTPLVTAVVIKPLFANHQKFFRKSVAKMHDRPTFYANINGELDWW